MTKRIERADLTAPPVERKTSGELYSLTAAQRRKVQALVRDCCNHDGGICLMLDSPCVQASSSVICCRWFRWAVLEDPANAVLKAEIFQDSEAVKQCALCGRSFVPKSNRATYCRACAKKVQRKKATERKRKQRENVTL